MKRGRGRPKKEPKGQKPEDKNYTSGKCCTDDVIAEHAFRERQPKLSFIAKLKRLLTKKR